LIDAFHDDGSHKDGFIAAFNQLPTNQNILNEKMQLYCEDGTTLTNPDEYAEFFYSIRNYYTHSGNRFHIMTDVRLKQKQNFMSGTRQNKNIKTLAIEPGLDLVDFICDVACFNAKKKFGWN
jgi:hypothetical protein